MKIIKSKESKLEEKLADAFRMSEPFELRCSDGKFIFQFGALLKIKNKDVSVWTGKKWEILTK